MDRAAYRHETLPAVLKPWNMRDPTSRSSTARTRGRRILPVSLLALAAAVSACKPPAKSAEKLAPEAAAALVSQLADARIDAAKSKLDRTRPDEALALLVSALEANPASVEARALAETPHSRPAVLQRVQSRSHPRELPLPRTISAPHAPADRSR